MRYFRNSFIRYFAMGLAFSLLTFLFGLFNVKAWNNTDNINLSDTSVTLPTNVAFYDVSSSTSWTYVGNSFSDGWQNYGVPMYTRAGGYGGTLCFSDLPLAKGYYYGIDVYMLSSSRLVFPIDADRRLTVGTNFDSAIQNYNSIYLRAHTWSRQVRFMKNRFCLPDSNNTLQCSWTYTEGNVFSAVFQPKHDATSICIPFTTEQDQNAYISIDGYVLTPLGASDTLISESVASVISGQGLATSSLVSSEANQTRQTVVQQNEQTRQTIENQESQTRDTLTNEDTTGSESSLSGVINDPTFSDSSGVNAIINLPLEFINSLDSTCSPLVLNLPHFNNISIPCMSTIYHKFAPFDTILSLVINGFVIYRVLIELFYIVKSSRDPDSDRVEVLDL